ncbi:hypothetical protein MNBD_BACTEROID05-1177 [hydrothermal vent metagenome]|uniref:Methyltransferase type 11 domain-containing protein n=1 Tax=hydrothermal vent metagenome TaxID=652676 RepID=A0A3B0T7N3_9ZZZZ
MKEESHKSEHIQKEYARLASNYDQRWASYVLTTVYETIKRIDWKDVKALLDVGCGTGELLKTVHSQFPEIKLSGVDLSREMLEVARQKLEENINLQNSSSEELSFDSESFDVVVSCSAFHFFENPVRVLREFQRVLKPKGKIVITDWCHDYLSCQVHDVFLHLFNRGHSRTYSVKEIKDIFKEAGLKNIKIDCYKINWLWGMMTVEAVRLI